MEFRTGTLNFLELLLFQLEVDENHLPRILLNIFKYKNVNYAFHKNSILYDINTRRVSEALNISKTI